MVTKARRTHPASASHRGATTCFFGAYEEYGSTNINPRNSPNIQSYLHNSVSGSNWIKSWGANSHGITLPYTIRDDETGVIFQVEADGRHVSAADGYGALLWYRDPFADAQMQYYRTNKPQIVGFSIHKRKPSEDWSFVEQVLGKKAVGTYISIGFNSSQCGFMDITTGDFHFTGQL